MFVTSAPEGSWTGNSRLSSGPISTPTITRWRQRHGNVGGVIFHSYPGSQFNNAKPISLYEKFKVLLRMGEMSTCYDHAGAKGFMSIFKNQHYYRHAFGTLEERRPSVSDYVNFYNHQQRCQRTGGVGSTR